MKKYLIGFIITLLCSSSFVQGQTTTKYDQYAEQLKKINVFQGTASGFELDRPPTRLEGLIMLLRLLGKEDDALEKPNDIESVFSDVPDWGVKYTNYAYEQGLTEGVGNGKFGADDPIIAKSYHTFLLRALGYDDSAGDFDWATANEFIYDLGIIDEEYYNDIVENTFLRDHVAKSSYDTLFVLLKDESITLLDYLVDTGDVDEIIASSITISENEVTYGETQEDENTNSEYLGENQEDTSIIQKVDSDIYIKNLDKKAEFIIIANGGDEAIDIGGWKVISKKGEQSFTFPLNYILQPGQECKLTSGEAQGTGEFDMAQTTIWNNSSSDPAILLDASGNQVDYYED